MTPFDMLAIFAGSMALVFLYGFQSRTVQAGRYAPAFIVSSLIGLFQTLITRAAVGDSLALFLIATCLGGSCGICLSIFTYERLYGRKDRA